MVGDERKSSRSILTFVWFSPCVASVPFWKEKSAKWKSLLLLSPASLKKLWENWKSFHLLYWSNLQRLQSWKSTLENQKLMSLNILLNWKVTALPNQDMNIYICIKFQHIKSWWLCRIRNKKHNKEGIPQSRVSKKSGFLDIKVPRKQDYVEYEKIQRHNCSSKLTAFWNDELKDF